MTAGRRGRGAPSPLAAAGLVLALLAAPAAALAQASVPAPRTVQPIAPPAATAPAAPPAAAPAAPGSTRVPSPPRGPVDAAAGDRPPVLLPREAGRPVEAARPESPPVILEPTGEAADAAAAAESSPEVTLTAPPRADAPPAAALPTAPEPEPTVPRPLGPTDAAIIAANAALPPARALTAAALALQNAVINYCSSWSTTPPPTLDRAFLDTVVAAGGIQPFAFGSEAARGVPIKLLTEVESTAFSRTRIKEIVTGRAAPPPTLASLQREEPALVGLPALERLVLLPSYATGESKPNRCRLAVPIAANIRSAALTFERSWERRELTPQWTDTPPELADRLRLRDLIQSMIDVIEALDGDVADFAEKADGNDRLPFTRRGTMIAYLDAVALALLRQTDVIEPFAKRDGPALEALARVRAAIEQARAMFAGRRVELPAAVALYKRAQEEIGRLPAAFGFDPGAFQQPLTTLQPTPAVAPAETVPAAAATAQ